MPSSVPSQTLATVDFTGIDLLIYAVIALFLMSIITEKFVGLARNYPIQIQFSVLALSLLLFLFSFNSFSSSCIDYFPCRFDYLVLIILSFFIATIAFSVLWLNFFASRRAITYLSKLNPFKKTRKKKDEPNSDENLKQISVLSFFVGFLVALLFNASIFEFLSSNPNHIPQKLGISFLTKIFDGDLQDPSSWSFNAQYTFASDKFIGYLLTGFFLSFGSSFFHDLLDRLYAVKRAQKALASKSTYSLENPEAVENILASYKPDLTKAAFIEAQNEFLSMDTVKAVSLKNNKDGNYIELVLVRADPSISNFYQYKLNNGDTHLIPIVKIILNAGETISVHGAFLNSTIYESGHEGNFGTFGCLVKKDPEKEDDILEEGETYLLTCYHNLLNPLSRIKKNLSDLPHIDPSSKEVGHSLGIVKKGLRTNLIDAAIIKLNHVALNKITNSIPSGGKPKGPRKVLEGDENELEVFVRGAVTTKQSGLVVSAISAPEIDYPNVDKHQFYRLIIVEGKNGLPFSKKGDSGSAVFDKDYNLIGLIVGGYRNVSYVIPANTIFKKLNIKLL